MVYIWVTSSEADYVKQQVRKYIRGEKNKKAIYVGGLAYDRMKMLSCMTLTVTA